MISAPSHPKEAERIAALARYDILDTEDEAAFDELTEIASAICDTEIALICFVDCQRQWFKSRIGLRATETPRSVAFCAHAILQEGIFEVPNALKDPRFADNPLVTGDPNIRFYAGAPLVSSSGMPLGTLCVIDSHPKQLNDLQSRALKTLANQVVSQLELRLHNRRLAQIGIRREQIFSVIAHDLRGPFNSILGFARTLSEKATKASPERIADMSRCILTASLNVYQLLDELLQWSQHQLGAYEARLGEHYLSELVKDDIKLLQDPLAIKQLTLDVKVPETFKVLADPTLTKTVIRNLIANAIKYSAIGGVIEVVAVEEDREILLRVVDHGKGIPEELRAKLFVEDQISAPGTAGEVGHGIGLHLCYEFMRMQQGRVLLEPSAEGTSIAMYLNKVG